MHTTWVPGVGPIVVRMVRTGRDCWAGGESFRCFYSEVAHGNTPTLERLSARSARRMRFVLNDTK